MSNTEVATPDPNIYKIVVTKAKGLTDDEGMAANYVEVDTSENGIPAHIYKHALTLGLKEMVNGGMTGPKHAKEAFKTEREFQEHAMETARDRAAQMMAGTLKILGAKAASDTLPREVQTEAMSIARKLIKAAIKEQGGRQIDYTSAQITQAAKDTLAANPWIIQKAKENLENRAAPDAKIAIPAPDPEHVKKVAAKKAIEKATKPLSPKQAAKTVIHAAAH